MVLYAPSDEETWVELVASEASLKLVANLGDRASLQEEANRVLKNSATMSLTAYKSAARLKLDEWKGVGVAQGLILIDGVVKTAASAQQRPSEQIYFAAIGETGISLTYTLTF